MVLNIEKALVSTLINQSSPCFRHAVQEFKREVKTLKIALRVRAINTYRHIVEL